MNSLEILKSTLERNKKYGKEVISIEYVLKKLREAEGMERPLRPPERLKETLERV